MKPLQRWMSVIFFVLGIGGLHLMGMGCLKAQDFPTKAIHYIVPFPPGGITDKMARTVGQRISEVWKQPVLVENRPSGNALSGADWVAKSSPDGHTWLAMTIAHAVNVSLYPQAPYNFVRDLKTVIINGSLPMVLVVAQNLPVKNLAELTALGKKRSLNGGSGGNGTPQHLAYELYRLSTGLDAHHIPYKGSMAPLISLIGGDVDFVITALPDGLPSIRSGKLRAIAITTLKRHSLIADTPTTAEADVPQLLMNSWTGVMVPSATPKEWVNRINAEVVKTLKQAEVAEGLRLQGFEVVADSVEASQDFVLSEVERLGKIVRLTHIQPD